MTAEEKKKQKRKNIDNRMFLKVFVYLTAETILQKKT